MVWYSGLGLWGLIAVGLLLGFIWSCVFLFIYRRAIKRIFIKKFFKKDYIECFFFNQNGQIDMYPTTIKDSKVTYSGNTYIVNPEFIKFKKNTPIGFWFQGYSFPIDYSLTQKEKDRIPVKADASTFNDIMNNKIIRDLVSESQNARLMLLILMAIGVVVVLIFAKQYGFIEWTMAQTGGVP